MNRGTDPCSCNQQIYLSKRISKSINGGINMKTGKVLFFLIIFFFVISSCQDNLIEFDNKSLTIYSRHGFVISYLNVDLEMSEQTFTILKKDGAVGNYKIKLDSIDNDYYIVKNNKEFSLVNTNNVYKKIPIMPNEEYVITNVSEGDATASKVVFRTDNNGKVK